MLETFDATVLEFDFVPTFVNGVNIAVVPGTTDPVSINTINNGNDTGGDSTPHHPEFFIDNVHPTVTLDTQMDGPTVILTCFSNVNPGVPNQMKLAIRAGADETC